MSDTSDRRDVDDRTVDGARWDGGTVGVWDGWEDWAIGSVAGWKSTDGLDCLDGRRATSDERWEGEGA